MPKAMPLSNYNFVLRISSLLFYLLILFLPTQLGKHFFLDFSFVSGFRIDYLAPTIYLTDILVFGLFVFWLINEARIMNHESRIKNKKPVIHNSKFLILSAFVAFLIFGILLSKNQPAGWYGLLKLLEFVFLGFYTAFNIKYLRFDVVLILFSAGIIFESFLSFAQFFNQGAIGGAFYFLGERFFNGQTPGIANATINGELILRPYGTFSHPNVLAGYLTIALAMVISNFQFFPRSGISLRETIFNFRRIFYILTLLTGTSALFLTMSRVAILIWLITLGIFLFSKFIYHKSYILILLGALLLLGLATPFGSRFTNLNLADESIVVRGNLVKSSLLMIKDNPFVGVGLNNFLVELPSYQKINNYFTELQPVHNIFLLVAVETGLIGLTFFVWFIFKTFKNLKIKNSLKISNFKFQILLLVLVLGLFDHYFLTLQQGQLLFSFLLGLCWSSGKK